MFKRGRNLSVLWAHANLFVRALRLGWLILSAVGMPSSGDDWLLRIGLQV